ncbi:hypothetical protein CON64_22475 [Bacillus pseudomycoides]|nr:hypothetical protein CON64_22475 [Bacillus pseudomycoides]
MKPVIPKQHGAWAMLLIPFLLSAFIGKATWQHILLFIAWLFIYLATYPFLMYMKQKRQKRYLHWTLIYFSLAILFGIIPLTYEWRILLFAIYMIPLFFINIYFARQKNERALLNDVSAIIVFCIGGMISYYFTMKTIDETAWLIALVSFLYFMGSTFYVKTMIREKKNPTYRWISWGYHLLLVIGTFIVSPWFVITFIPSCIRAIVLYGKKITVLKVGVWEIVNSVYFFITTTVLFQLKG